MADQEDFLAQQKEQCVFCRIVKGEIPSQKVYEDTHLIAVLDINPASKGHLLVIPKEHYPILQTMPLAEREQVFATLASLSKALRQAILCEGVTAIIPGGAAAGQMVPHASIHLIPRERNDGLEVVFSLPGKQEYAMENDKLAQENANRISGIMRAYLDHAAKKTGTPLRPLTPQQSTPVASEQDQEEPQAPVPEQKEPFEERLERLIKMIDENDDLREAIIERPEEVKEAAKNMEKWRALFEGVDIDQLSRNLKAMASAHAKRMSQEPEVDEDGEIIAPQRNKKGRKGVGA